LDWWRTVNGLNACGIAAMMGLCGFLVGCETGGKPPPPEMGANQPVERFEFESSAQIEKLFDDLDYTPAAWQAGIREVPRIYITDVPQRWRDKTSKEVSVETKKRLFFRLLGPLVLHANELVKADRDRAESIVAALRAGKTVDAQEQAFLRDLAVSYNVTTREVDATDRAAQDELLRRIDTVPPSLALAQAAEESGWGTSRFAVQGNGLFGMWTWSGTGMTPQQQRAELGSYQIAAYETPLRSVMAYMHNLNTHANYATLRARRAELRRAGGKVTGWELAGTLTKYSERGQAYVDSLRALMKANALGPTDDAFLRAGPTIMLIPVGAGT
jgi:Bax protein